MKLNSAIFKSKIPPDGRYGPRFANPEQIQEQLAKICRAWARYLKEFVAMTGEPHKAQDLPWMNTERAMVSTLSAAISRRFRRSIVMEESRVMKPGRDQVPEAHKARGWGRCDLWAGIEDGQFGSFDFYLEAKMSDHSLSDKRLQTHLCGYYGISRLFRDYFKLNPKAPSLSLRSPYSKRGGRGYYLIGMLVTQLEPKVDPTPRIMKTLKAVFENPQPLFRGRNASEANARRKRQVNMVRLPTVALILRTADGSCPGFIASFTVLGSTKALAYARMP